MMGEWADWVTPEIAADLDALAEAEPVVMEVVPDPTPFLTRMAEVREMTEKIDRGIYPRSPERERC